MLSAGRLQGKAEGVAYALRGLAYLDRGDIAHAIADLNQAISLAPDFAPAYQNRGNAWYARGNYGQALADYDTAIKLDPNSPSPYVNRATVRRDLGYVDGALEDYQKAISLGADSARLYGGRGQLYLRQRDYVHALADFDHALQIEPSAANYLLRGHSRQDSGDFDRALADYAEAERLDPKNIGSYTAQAVIWTMKDDFDKAIAVYDRAIAADQTRAATYALRAHAYDQKGDRKRAMSDISRAIKLSSQADFLNLRGTLRLQDGDTDGVLHDADAVLKLDADNPTAFALRGAAFNRKKQYDRALADLDRAIKGDPKNALAYGERGQVYLAKSDNDHALADLNHAIALGATSAGSYRARATIYVAKGDTRSGGRGSQCGAVARPGQRREHAGPCEDQTGRRRDGCLHGRLRCRAQPRAEKCRRDARPRRGAGADQQLSQGHRRSRSCHPDRTQERASLLPARLCLRTAGSERQGDCRLPQGAVSYTHLTLPTN